MYNNNKPPTTFIRNLYSPGFSSLTMSFFGTNLALSFNQYLGKDHRGIDQYCRKRFLSTSINYEGAALFILTAMSISDGIDSEKQIQAVLPCNNNAALIFEYKPDQNNQWGAYLTINKNNDAITFRFKTHESKVRRNGEMVTEVIQSGVGAFAMTLEGYLKGIGAANHLTKLPEDELYAYLCKD